MKVRHLHLYLSCDKCKMTIFSKMCTRPTLVPNMKEWCSLLIVFYFRSQFNNFWCKFEICMLQIFQFAIMNTLKLHNLYFMWCRSRLHTTLLLTVNYYSATCSRTGQPVKWKSPTGRQHERLPTRPVFLPSSLDSCVTDLICSLGPIPVAFRDGIPSRWFPVMASLRLMAQRSYRWLHVTVRRLKHWSDGDSQPWPSEVTSPSCRFKQGSDRGFLPMASLGILHKWPLHFSWLTTSILFECSC